MSRRDRDAPHRLAMRAISNVRGAGRRRCPSRPESRHRSTCSLEPSRGLDLNQAIVDAAVERRRDARRRGMSPKAWRLRARSAPHSGADNVGERGRFLHTWRGTLRDTSVEFVAGFRVSGAVAFQLLQLLGVGDLLVERLDLGSRLVERLLADRPSLGARLPSLRRPSRETDEG
jgi:hypothetical protein